MILTTKEGIAITCNNDLSGEVRVEVPTASVERVQDTTVVFLPSSLLLRFAAMYVQREKIAWLETASVEELLEIPKRRLG